MDEILASCFTLSILDILLQLLILSLDISQHSKVVIPGKSLSFVDESLLLSIDISDVGYVTVSLTQLILEHSNDLLDLVDLWVDALWVPSGFSKWLEELNALHLGVSDDSHVVHFLGNQLFFKLRRIFVVKVDLTKISLVVCLQFVSDLLNFLTNALEQPLLLWSDLRLEIQVFPLVIDGVSLHDYICMNKRYNLIFET